MFSVLFVSSTYDIFFCGHLFLSGICKRGNFNTYITTGHPWLSILSDWLIHIGDVWGTNTHQVVLTRLISVNESRKVHWNPLKVLENVRNFIFFGPMDGFQCRTQNSICLADHRIRWAASQWLNQEHQLKPALFYKATCYPKAIPSFNLKAQRLFLLYATGFKVITVFTGRTQWDWKWQNLQGWFCAWKITAQSIKWY